MRLIRERQPDVVQTYMGRATSLTRLPGVSRALHVVRLGGYYKIDGYDRHADAWIGNTRDICTYRIAFGPRAGRKVLTVQGAMPKESGFDQMLCANNNGFSLHAGVRCGADDRQALEQLCRYLTHPALANERVQWKAPGQVVRKPKAPWRDDTTRLVLSPLEFMQQMAALVRCPSRPAPGCLRDAPR